VKLLLPLLLMIGGQSALAKTDAVSLPPELQMESDEDYEHYEDYRPLAQLNGSYVSGRRSGSPDYTHQLRRKAPGKRCRSTYKIASQRPENEDETVLYVWPEEHFWFYRHRNQALFIEMAQVAFKEDECVLKLRPEIRITRGVFIGDRLTTFRADTNGKLSFETTVVNGSFGPQIPENLIFDGLSGLRKSGSFGGRQIFEEPWGKPKLTGVKEECFNTSNGLDGGVKCYISSPGPLYGRKSFSTFHYHVVGGDWYDDSYSYWELLEAKPRVKLDSRLFEWDRKIKLVDAETVD